MDEGTDPVARDAQPDALLPPRVVRPVHAVPRRLGLARSASLDKLLRRQRHRWRSSTSCTTSPTTSWATPSARSARARRCRRSASCRSSARSSRRTYAASGKSRRDRARSPARAALRAAMNSIELVLDKPTSGVCAAARARRRRSSRSSRKNPIRGAMGLLLDDRRHRRAVPRAARAVPRGDPAHRLRRRGRRPLHLRDHAARPRRARRRATRGRRSRARRRAALFGVGWPRARCRCSSHGAADRRRAAPRRAAERLRQRRGRSGASSSPTALVPVRALERAPHGRRRRRHRRRARPAASPTPTPGSRGRTELAKLAPRRSRRSSVSAATPEAST